MTPGKRQARSGFGSVIVGILIGVVVSGVVGVVLLSPALLMGIGSTLTNKVYGDAMVGVTSQRALPAMSVQAFPGQRRGGTDDQQTNAGRNSFTGSCAQCHGINGDGKGPQGLLSAPPATDLTGNDAKQKTDAQLAWIIKNGIAFTAMPGYVNDYREDDINAIVGYIRSLQNGKAQPITVPTPPPAHFAFADPRGTQAQRGAALYFAQGCQGCHGAVGDDSNPLAQQDISEAADVIRKGQPGMPAFGNKLSEAQIADIVAFLNAPPQ